MITTNIAIILVAIMTKLITCLPAHISSIFLHPYYQIAVKNLHYQPNSCYSQQIILKSIPLHSYEGDYETNVEVYENVMRLYRSVDL